ncbi:MFS transporter [Alcaligenes aquatilis]|uniref:MFS transporter n=1 Tax=Alcaligenes aquatilis TaxID=323284 RepID=UPI00196B513E|nr:MFS transporter [Alcaligenes aquatilis]
MIKTENSRNEENVSWRTWLAVVALGVSSFAIVTTELAPIGLLSPLAAEFGQTEGKAGLIVTAYAWVAALAALLSATFLGRFPRKPLLVGLMLVLTISSTIAAFGSEFSTLMGARMVGALAHGAFWAMIGSIGAQLVPSRKVGLATSIIFGGVSVASVLGVPLANLLTQLDGWRTAFMVIAALSLAATLAIALTVPRLPVSTTIGVDALVDVLRNRTFRRIYLATGCAITAHFAAFTFIEPFLSNALNTRVNLISTLLLVFGVAGVVGNLISGKLIDRYLKPLVLISLTLMAVSVLAIGCLPADSSAFVVGMLLLGWGVGVAIVFVGLQTWILRLAGQAAMPASAIYVAIFNAAIGAGALLGGIVLSMTSLSGLMVIAAAAIAASLVPVMLIKPPTP